MHYNQASTQMNTGVFHWETFKGQKNPKELVIYPLNEMTAVAIKYIIILRWMFFIYLSNPNRFDQWISNPSRFVTYRKKGHLPNNLQLQKSLDFVWCQKNFQLPKLSKRCLPKSAQNFFTASWGQFTVARGQIGAA